jgi:phage tail-like protein
MEAPRPFALLRTLDQWSRAAHVDTEIDADSGGVELERIEPESGNGHPAAQPAGLAFDHECRLYRSIPDEGRVVRQLWAAVDPLGPAKPESEPVDLLAGATEPAEGDFAPEPPGPPPLLTPRGLAVDCNDMLFVAESAAGRVLVYDLWNRRLLRAVGFDAPPGTTARPVDLAASEDDVLCVLEDGRLFRFTARGEPVAVALAVPYGAPPDARATRVAVAPGGAVVVLLVDSGGTGWIAPQSGRARFPTVAHATDLEFAEDDSLVVAALPGEDFTRFRIEGGAVVIDAPLKGRNYDGSAIVRTPDGRIAFWTARGLRDAVVARSTFKTDGHVTTYRLDSGEYHTDWGRLFLDACIPSGCDVTVFFSTADDLPEEPTVARTPPPNLTAPTVRPELSPPMPPVSLAPSDGATFFPLHRREAGREVPWARFASNDAFETYEAPVNALPGRYLWVTLALHGTGHATPRIRSLRAEHPSHDLLRRLPKAFSRDTGVASFLRRYLAIFDGTLGDLQARADARDVLLDPHATPEEALPWLASFLGLALDERWPLTQRRELIAEVPVLWRERGTVMGLTRFLELYLGRTPVLVEHYRLRGLGGALLSDEGSTLFAGAVVGTNFRVGGAVGQADEQPLTGDTASAFATHAHRFTVLVPALLDADGFDVVRDILDAQRPAHTIVDLCTIESGMRVGYGLHVGLLSVIGRSGGFETLRLDASRIGRRDILGRPAPGAKLGIDSLETGMRVG